MVNLASLQKVALLPWVALLGLCSPVLGYHIDGHNPSGATSATADGTLFVYLQPAAVITQTAANDSWLINALAAQGYVAPAWTVRYHGLTLDGGYTVGTYLAWVNNALPFNQGSIQYPGRNRPGFGGDEIGLHYDAGTVPPPDPTGAGVHWINIVSTNTGSPFPGGTGAYHPQPNLWQFIDDFGNPAGNPFYDAAFGWANSTDFLDVPNAPMNGTSQMFFHTYIATGDLNNKVLDIYDGVAWGFQEPIASPEPSTWILSLSGAAFLVVFLAFRHLLVKHPTPLGL